jgi:hypothetical protein
VEAIVNPFTQSPEDRASWQKWWADNAPDQAMASARKIGLTEGDCRSLGMVQGWEIGQLIDPDAYKVPLPEKYWEWRERQKKRWSDTDKEMVRREGVARLCDSITHDVFREFLKGLRDE